MISYLINDGILYLPRGKCP